MTRDQIRSFMASRIVADILGDLTGRRGLRHEWDHIDPEIQDEIRSEWEALVLNRLEDYDLLLLAEGEED